MSSFTRPIVELMLSPLGDGKTWIVRTPFEFYWDNPKTGNREYIVVGADFDTDFASVPRIFWPLISPWGKHGKAAILHDRLYRYKEYTRTESDQIMKEAMNVLGVPKWQIFIIYYSLRVGGVWGWYKLKNKDGWKSLINEIIDS